MKYATIMATLGLMFLFAAGCSKEPDTQSPTSSNIQKEEAHEEFPKPTDPSLMAGYKVFAQVCSHCHIESEYAPVINNPKDWQKRLHKRDKETLLKHAIEGYGDMSPKGGRRGKDLTDKQVAEGLNYILSLLPKSE